MRNKNTLFIGKVVHAYEELPSTNDYAQQLLSKSDPSEGTVITAGHQTAGRGQIGSRWYSAAGESLCASVILYPRFLAAQQQYRLNLSVALALREALSYFVPGEVWIKWPNDLYHDGYKLAGILIQNTLQGRQVGSSIIGFGVNVNQTGFPAEAPRAVSIRQVSGENQSIAEVTDAVLKALEQYYLLLRSGRPLEALLQEYYKWMWGYGQERSFAEEDGQAFRATISGIDKHGKLRLTRNGREKSYGLKEIRFLS